MTTTKERPKTAWMQVMAEGQHTRDAAHRTRQEREKDRQLAEEVAQRRRTLFPKSP